MIRKPHIRLIAGHAVRHGIRGGAGLVSMLLTLVLGLGLASVIISPLEELERQMDQAGVAAGASAADRTQMTTELYAQVISVTRKAIDWAVSPSPEQLDYLTTDHPAAVSAILVLLFLVTPLLVCLGGFNQTSGDIGTRGLRFLLIRTERPNIFVGRFLGTFLYTAAVFAALFLILALYMAVKIKVHETGPMMLWLASGYLRLLVFALPYVAICAFVSASIDSPFGSLVVALLIAYMIPLFIGMAANVNDAARHLQYATPWGFKYWLLMPLGPQLFGGIAAMLAFTGLFLFIGLRHFSARDL